MLRGARVAFGIAFTCRVARAEYHAFSSCCRSCSLSLVSATDRDAAAVTIGGNPGPEAQLRLPSFRRQAAHSIAIFDAVAHLYTMCRNVKSIEIIEFGYEKSTEGTNGAKSEYCLDKQRQNIAQPYQAALKEAKVSQQAVEGLRSLQERGCWR